MLTIAISGPKRTRAKAELLLEEARIPVYPDRHWAVRDWACAFPDDKDVFLAVEHDDVDEVARIVEGARWRLRMHYETPPEPKRSEAQALRATLDEMRAEIDALKARADA